MRMAVTVLTLLISLALATPSYAQALKIAVVDLQTALNEVDEGKRAKKTIESQMEDAGLRIQKEQAAIEELGSEIQAQSVMLSESALREKEAEYNKRAAAFQQTYLKTQQEMTLMEQELTGEVLRKLSETAAEIGKEKGYTLILEKTAVLYQAGGMDITQDVITRHNSK